jgi:hypothetical protein
MNADAVTGGTWQTDLLVLDHGANRSVTVVGDDSGTWNPL